MDPDPTTDTTSFFSAKKLFNFYILLSFDIPAATYGIQKHADPTTLVLTKYQSNLYKQKFIVPLQLPG
jgi:hypothetical protein